MLAVRASMSDHDVRRASDVIQQKVIDYLKNLKESPFTDRAKVHIYTPIAKNKEVSTDEIINYLKMASYVSVLHTFIQINGAWQNTSLKKQDTVIEEFVNYDLIIVPMLAGDQELNRLGYGSGFYDKFLSSQPKAVKLGLCFQENIVDKLLIEPHDMTMDLIVSA